MHRWDDLTVKRLVANKDKAFTVDVKKHMDMLVTELITLSEPHPLLVLLVSLVIMLQHFPVIT